MGIDKPDVETVVHMDIPDHLENYYQGSRCGKETVKSHAVSLYTQIELDELKKLPGIKYPAIAKSKCMPGFWQIIFDAGKLEKVSIVTFI